MFDKDSAGIFLLGSDGRRHPLYHESLCGWKQNMSTSKPSDYQCHKSKTVSIECRLAET